MFLPVPFNVFIRTLDLTALKNVDHVFFVKFIISCTRASVNKLKNGKTTHVLKDFHGMKRFFFHY